MPYMIAVSLEMSDEPYLFVCLAFYLFFSKNMK